MRLFPLYTRGTVEAIIKAYDVKLAALREELLSDDTIKHIVHSDIMDDLLGCKVGEAVDHMIDGTTIIEDSVNRLLENATIDISVSNRHRRR